MRPRGGFELVRRHVSNEDQRPICCENQSRWVKSYTAACSVPLDGPVPSLPASPSIIDCFKRASRARTAELSARLGGSAAVPDPLPTAEEAFGPRPLVVNAIFGACLTEQLAFQKSAHIADPTVGARL